MEILNELDCLQDLFISRLRADPLFGALIEGTISQAHLCAVYQEIWHCVCETPRSLAAAAKTLSLYRSSGARFSGEEFARFRTPFYGAILEELETHAREERGHDDWMMSDLVALGADAEAVRRSQPGPAMSAYLAVFRHAAVGRTPLGVSGQAYMLEGLGPLLWAKTVENLRRRSNIPNIAQAVYCLASHAEVDRHHREEARRRLVGFTDRRDYDAIVFNARATIDTWGGLSFDIIRRG